MYSPVHATAGLFLAQVMPNPAAAFLAGVASHYILDAIPHGDTDVGSWMTARHPFKRIAAVEVFDLGIAALVIGWLVIHHADSSWKLVAGAVGGITPDLLWGAKYVLAGLGLRLPLITSWLNIHQRWHTYVHAKKGRDLSFLAGLGYQVVVLVLVLLLYV